MTDEMMGYKFQPGQANMMKKSMNGQASQGGNMANQALRVLSLRIPNVLGGKPLAPQSLMTPPTGGSGPTNNPLTVSGPGQAPSNLAAMISGAVSGSPSQSPQSPNFTPGVGDGNYAGGIQGAPAPAWDTQNGPAYGGITGGINYGPPQPQQGAPTYSQGGFGGLDDFMNPNSGALLGLLSLLGGRG